MHDIDLILTLAAGLGVALAFGLLALRLKLPSIVGYLLAGLFLGPNTPGFVADRGFAQQMAELGVVLLMFGVGLHFHLKDLLAVRKVAMTVVPVQVAVAALGAWAAHELFGWTWAAGAIFGVAVSVASTVVLTRVLADNRDLQSESGRIAIGWLVVEDVFTVLALVVLPVVFSSSSGGDGPGIAAALGMAVVKVALLLGLTLGPGSKLIPRLLGVVARTNSRELFTLTVLVLALGIAVLSAKIFGVSVALGAFLAGMIVGQSEFSFRAASEALPMRDAFAVIFFVSVGMLLNPGHVFEQPMMILITVAIILTAKPLAAFAITTVLGSSLKVSLRVAVALGQIGEFSFIVASLGDQLKILPEGATDTLIAASIISITINPLLYQLVPKLEGVILTISWLRKAFEPKRQQMENNPVQIPTFSAQAVVIGYGPVGQSVVQLLRQHGIEPTVVELNIETCRQLVRKQIRAVYGDATQDGILLEAGIEQAAALILSPRATEESVEVVKLARKLNPAVRILARASFLTDALQMRDLGSDEVFSGEAEVAMAMVESILRKLGSTPEYMDQQRRLLRQELYGASTLS